jgi:hypothetical protein
MWVKYKEYIFDLDKITYIEEKEWVVEGETQYYVETNLHIISVASKEKQIDLMDKLLGLILNGPPVYKLSAYKRQTIDENFQVFHEDMPAGIPPEVVEEKERVACRVEHKQREMGLLETRNKRKPTCPHCGYMNSGLSIDDARNAINEDLGMPAKSICGRCARNYISEINFSFSSWKA